MSRKIISSDIIQKRINQRETNNLWYYVNAINGYLETNTINIDSSIDIVFYFQIEQHMIDQIVETYENVGWAIDVNISSTNFTGIKSISGRTNINFSPI